MIVNARQVGEIDVDWKLNGFTFSNLRMLARREDQQSIYLQANSVGQASLPM